MANTEARLPRLGLIVGTLLICAASASAALSPLHFEANQGQAAAPARFLARGSGLSVLPEPGAIRVILASGEEFRLRLAVAAEPVPGLQALTHAHYAAGNVPDSWIENVPVFESVMYPGVAPGVDLLLAGDGLELRAELRVAPMTAAGELLLQLEGASAASDGAGAVVLTVGEAKLTFSITEGTGGLLPLDGRTVPMPWPDAIADGGTTVRFSMRAHAPQVSPEAAGSALAIDASGTRFVVGRTGAAGLAPAGMSDEPWRRADAFLVRVPEGANAPISITWFGGVGDDVPSAVRIGPAGEAVVAGWTTSTDFPGVSSPRHGPSDAFVAWFTTDGSRPAGAALYGGEGHDEALALALGADGRAWIAGRSTSAAPLATSDAFVAAVDLRDGNALGVTLGGSADESAQALAFEPSGDAVVLGTTDSVEWPAGESIIGSPADGFVARIAAGGNAPAPLLVRRLAGTAPAGRARLGLGPDGSVVVLLPIGSRVTVTDSAADDPQSVARALAFEVGDTLLSGADPAGHTWIAGRRDGANWHTGRLASAGAIADEGPIPLASSVRANALAVDEHGRSVVAGVAPAASADAGLVYLGPAPGGAEHVLSGPADTPEGEFGVCPGTINFDNSTFNNSWHTAANWDLDRLPNSTDDVCISSFSVTFSSGNQDIATLRVQDGGSLTITGGQLTLGSGTSEIGTFTLNSGVLTGAGLLTLTDHFTWSGGNMTGSGTTTANGGLTMSGASGKLLGRTLRIGNNSTAVNNGGGNFSISGVLEVLAGSTFDQQSDGGIAGSGQFTNAGTFVRTTSTGSSTISCPFDNNGTVDVQTGTLVLSGNGAHAGDFDATGAVLRFGGGTQTLAAGADVSGTRVEFGNANVTVNGGYAVTGTTQVTGNVTFNAAATLTSLGAAYEQSAGVVNLNSGETATVTTINHSAGTLQGSDAINVSGLYTWTGGTLSGDGVSTAQGGLVISGASGKLLGRTLRIGNNSTAVNNGGGNFSINSPGVLEILAGSTFDQQSDGGIAGSGQFTNAGTFVRTTSIGSSTISCPFDNNGTVDVQTGTLVLSGNGTHAGDFDATGAVLRFGGGTQTLAAGADVSGTRVEFGNANVTVNGGYAVTGTTQVAGNVTFNAAATLTSLGAAYEQSAGVVNLNSGETATVTTINHSAGTLQGSDAINVSGLYTWTGGTLSGSGVSTAQGGLVISGASGKNLGRTLRIGNNSTAVNNGGGNFSINSPGVLEILAGSTFDQQSDGSIAGNGQFTNSGTFVRTTSTGSSSIFCPFDNNGTVDVQTGTLVLSGNGTHAGDFDATGAVLRFGGATHTVATGADISGTRVEFGNGSVTLNGGYAVTGTTQVAGNVTFNAAATLTSLGAAYEQSAGVVNLNSGETATVTTINHSAGTLQGSDAINVSGLYTWTGGTLSGSGVSTANGGLALSGASSKLLVRTLRNANNGTATHTGPGNLSINSPGLFENLSGSLFDQQDDSDIPGSGQFVNAGTFLRSADAGTVTIGCDVDNTGLFEVRSGKVGLTGTYSQSAGSTIVNGAVLESFPSLSISGGIVGGAGTMDAALTMAGGQLGPGLSPGVLAVADDLAAAPRNYTQAAGASFHVEVGGLSPGNGPANHDQLTVSGTASLNGPLHVTLVNGFLPNVGDSITILTAASRVGTFSTNPEPMPECRIWRTEYLPGAVVLHVEQVPVELSGLRIAANGTTLNWNAGSPAAGTVHDVARGRLGQFPVGSGVAETCVVSGTPLLTAEDATTPGANEGFWYLVRERVPGCGTNGTYGFASGGAERVTAVCP
ncbi:MAG: hypothetical protein KBD01_13765 [Acidobacteria bacterium]|nr:hypothetical protein [Acidobacteriota bacterium]